MACALFKMKLKLLPIKKELRTCSDTGEGTCGWVCFISQQVQGAVKGHTVFKCGI